MKTFWIILIIIVVLIIAFLIWGKFLMKKQELAYADLNEYAACVKINDAMGIVSGEVACQGLKDKIKAKYGLDDFQIKQYLLKTK